MRKSRNWSYKSLSEIAVLEKELEHRANTTEGTLDYLMKRYSLSRNSITRISGIKHRQASSASELVCPLPQCCQESKLQDTKQRRRAPSNTKFLVLRQNTSNGDDSVQTSSSSLISSEVCDLDAASHTNLNFRQVGLVSCKDAIERLEEAC